MYIATFTNREPSARGPVKEHPDVIPWGAPYVPGSSPPAQSDIACGIYTLKGKASGSAKVNITMGTLPAIGTISVSYSRYSDDGKSYLEGNETVTGSVSRLVNYSFDWYSDIKQSGAVKGTKKTSKGGYLVSVSAMENVLSSTGSLVTTLNGVKWSSPASGT
ncbi:hypothetical protein ACHAPJ_009763 [Fusarium lateritium]